MGKIEKFEDIIAWQKARELDKEIISLILNSASFSKDFALIDQMKRSSGSIMDNLAEGFERGGNKEFIQFLYISKSSCGELRSQLYRSYDRGYIDNNTLEEFKIKTKFFQIDIKYFFFIEILPC